MDIFPEFTGDFDFWILLRLVAAAILGGIIGFERSGNRHEAGLRTHIIVCLGAAAIMIIGELICLRYGGDPARMSAQVISGIGFLGAGSIMDDSLRRYCCRRGLLHYSDFYCCAHDGGYAGTSFIR